LLFATNVIAAAAVAIESAPKIQGRRSLSLFIATDFTVDGRDGR
jgi:hypothetical protein